MFDRQRFPCRYSLCIDRFDYVVGRAPIRWINGRCRKRLVSAPAGRRGRVTELTRRGNERRGIAGRLSVSPTPSLEDRCDAISQALPFTLRTL